ncbi:hypothetical protein NtRootA4_27090 [Arthrobacter sp. NtRootA4]|nr:hypothetical protein NtRootA2_29280 [Arthrobacter sp. NtRootA2]BCW15730.1 hypothetical protein NtRootA4_27090 [Arthrobacter sp. NtRootA4]BCW24064.1 hypothetical protein NtRootC7_29310 [Arthrobacter sp. NtRootC7]BCW28332.1 hypothetical protein NtRootC45_29320 [Arthrobacter sp. NtRootC45]BCW32602.1 hypothetical protein NtRootD5_29330 [Arthrobacter sp. NtRootD5]
MDPAIRFGQECPRDAVEEDPDTGEERKDNEDSAHDQRINAEPVGYTTGNPADPTVRSTADALVPNPIEEVLLGRLGSVLRRRVGPGSRASARRRSGSGLVRSPGR